MEQIQVKVVNRSGGALPSYATPQSAGMDVRAFLPGGAVTIAPGERALVPTGLYIQLPDGYECQMRPRSGLALKHGVTVLNSPGTIDADYRGEVGIVLINHGCEPVPGGKWRAYRPACYRPLHAGGLGACVCS